MNLKPQHALDHRRGRELLVGDSLFGVALALQRHLQTAEVVEHHHLALGERFGDMLLHAQEHSATVGLRHGGAVVDTAGQLLEGELTRLDGLTMVVVGALGTLGVLHFLYGVGDWHG